MKHKHRFPFRRTVSLLITCVLFGALAISAIWTSTSQPKVPKTEPSPVTTSATTQESEAPEITEELKPTIPIYNIPLSDELQTYTFSVCEEYGVDYEMVLELMNRESSFRPSVISKSNDYGLMQINSINHETLKEALGITDFLDPEQNILCGVYLLGRLTAKYEDPHRILMAYNMGERGAREYVEKGNTSTAYSRAIMELREELLQQKGEQK